MTFPFDDVLKLEAEEEALPDIPSFPSIYGQPTIKTSVDKQARLNRQDNTFVCPHCLHISKPR